MEMEAPAEEEGLALAPDTMLLARSNAHPRDERIRFDEQAHAYYVDDLRYPGSVSGLVHEYFPQFDAVSVIDKYYDKWKIQKEGKYAALIKYLTNALGLSEELVKLEIARSWSASGRAASGAGTDTHLQIELCLNQVRGLALAALER
jgi:hypothetical protein